MAFDVAPMPEVFRACYDVLQKTLRPIHYRDLTERALWHLHLTRKMVQWNRQIEDVREKMLLAGQFETFYLKRPFCLGGLKRWFDSRQLALLKPTDGIFISGDVSCAVQAAFEALMRSPYMFVKVDTYRRSVAKHYDAFNQRFPHGLPEYDTRNVETIMKTRARGIVIETHVRAFFARTYPAFYQDASNFQQWHQVCSEDFFLTVNDRKYKIDVSGKKLDETYGGSVGKHPVDFHLMCDIEGDKVRWISVVPKSEYGKHVFPEIDGFSPERMLVWLNCVRDGLPYDAIKAAAKRVLAAANN